jgi:hypothetical protein
MPKARLNFRQRDVRAALKAARQAGEPVRRVEIGPDGRIVLVMGKGNAVDLDQLNPTEDDENPWDRRV